MNSKDNKITKIAVVGPESTGKSSMAKYLARELDTICVPEYARYYCAHLNKQYTLQDELNMFYGQLALEDALIPQAKNNLLICDTTILTVKIWSDRLFQHTPHEVLNEIKNHHYDFYLLMDIDLPWEDDPLRDFPNEREHFMKVWKQELNLIQADYAVISGVGDDRYFSGLKTVKDFINQNAPK